MNLKILFDVEIFEDNKLIVCESLHGNLYVINHTPQLLVKKTFHGLHGVVVIKGLTYLLLGWHPIDHYGFKLLKIDLTVDGAEDFVRKVIELTKDRTDKYLQAAPKAKEIDVGPICEVKNKKLKEIWQTVLD